MDAEFRQYVLDACINGKLKCKDAAKLLGMHPKSFSRLKRRYLQEGPSVLIRKKPGPKEFTPPNRTPREVEQQVADIAFQHADMTIQALAELLNEQHGIDLHPTTVWRILKRCEHKEQESVQLKQPAADIYHIYDDNAPAEAYSTSSSPDKSERVVTYSGLPHEPVEVSDE